MESQTPSYGSYDLICCVEDNPNVKFKVYGMANTTFFSTCIVVSLIGGFCLHMVINSRKYRQGIKDGLTTQQKALKQDVCQKTMELEDPVKFATRALGWGTLYALLGSGTIGLTAVCIWKL
jgi:hypothetical protein